MKHLIQLFFLCALFFPLVARPKNITINVSHKNGNHFKLKIAVPNGYGIQKEAPNRLFLIGESGLKIIKADTRFKGLTNPKKQDYFLSVAEMPFTVTGNGILKIRGKIFYCNFRKNICKFERINETKNIR